MAFIICVDENGNEISRKKKGRGRPPTGTVRDNDGNFHVIVKEKKDQQIYYVWKDFEGKVVRRERKGRGRPKPGFEKGPDGNWYRLDSVPVKP